MFSGANAPARIVARGGELADYNDVTLRAVSANADFLKARPQAAKAFDAAYQESVERVYANLDKAIEHFCKEFGTPADAVRQRVDDFYSKTAVSLHPITGIDRQIQEALQVKAIPRAPTADELKELIVDIRAMK